MAKTKPLTLVKVPFWQDDKKVAWIFFGFAFLLYAQTIGYGFALDDVAVIGTNNFVQKGFSGIGQILKTFYWAGCPAFATANSGLFRPLSLILFAVEWQLFQKSPHVFHFVNVLLYAISAFLLYKTLRELFRSYSITLPFLATLLWIVFPAHTEVVANIKSGDELLSTIFFLLMMRQLLKWNSENQMKTLSLSGIYFFLSLISKEGAILFLPMALIALFIFRNKTAKDLIRPLAILSCVTLIWFAWHYAVIANAPSEKITYTYHDNALVGAPDFSTRLATALHMQGKYLVKSFTSFPLSYDYSYNENPYVGFSNPFVLLSIAVCLGLLCFALMKIKKEPVLSFGILFYFITFALTSNIFILIGATMADRFLFVPSLGFVIAVVWLVMKITKGAEVKYFHANSMYILLSLACLYSIRTFSRSQDWSDENVLYQKDVDNAPGSGRVQANCGIIYMNSAFAEKDENNKKQMLDVAFEHFYAAVKIDSLDYKSQLCLGQVEYNRKNYASSARWSLMNLNTFKKLNAPPNDITVYSNLGLAYMMLGKYDSARIAFNNGILANPKDEHLYISVGNSYLAEHDTTNAIKYFEQSVTINSSSVEAWDKLANVCGMTGKYKRSNEAFSEIAKLDSSNPNPYKMIATNYLMMGDSVRANDYWQEYKKRGGK